MTKKPQDNQAIPKTWYNNWIKNKNLWNVLKSQRLNPKKTLDNLRNQCLVSINKMV